MYLNKIRLSNFRNYLKQDVEFSDKLNIICGYNAQGKTNLLEAIAFLSTGKSFRTSKDAELINYNSDKAYLHAYFYDDDIQNQIEALIQKKSKSIKINSQPIRKLGDLFGVILCVVFSPEDLRLFKDIPQLRRRFLDIEISKIKNSYYHDLVSYNKNLQQKNALLKQNKTIEEIKPLIEVYNQSLADYAEKIVKRRLLFCDEINSKLTNIYNKIAMTDENITLKYKPCIESNDVSVRLFEKYQQNMKNEIEMKTTLYGTHREDFSVYIEDREAKLYASQGQQRTLVISLKLAVAEIVKKFSGKDPIILLDDILSELDISRQTGLINCFSQNQLIITTALNNFDIFTNPNIIKVENGKIIH